MELKDIAAVSGKSGLFQILKPSKAGVIIESMDDKKQKMVAGIHHKVSILDEISIYVNTEEGSTPLKNVFEKIYKEFEDDPGVDASSSSEELKAFFKHILPDYDEVRVYTSDIKKVITWYHILLKVAPEVIKSSKKPSKKKETKNDKKKD